MRPWRNLVPSRANQVAAVVLTTLSAWMFWLSFQLETYGTTGPGPDLFPKMVTSLLMVLGIVWFLQANREPPRNQQKPNDVSIESHSPIDSSVAQAAEAPTTSTPALVSFVIVWALVPILLLTVTGFTLTMTIYVSGMLIVVGGCNRIRTLPFTLIGVVLFAVGANMLGMYLPEPFDYLSTIGL